MSVRTVSRVTVRVPTPLRGLVDGAAEVGVAGETVEAALAALTDRHPRLRRHLFAEGGAVRDYVNIFVNERDIRSLSGVATAVTDGDVITIVPSIAGGRGGGAGAPR